MDKAIKKHFKPLTKSPVEKQELGQMLKIDKKLDSQVDADQKKKMGKKNGKANSKAKTKTS